MAANIRATLGLAAHLAEIVLNQMRIECVNSRRGATRDLERRGQIPRRAPPAGSSRCRPADFCLQLPPGRRRGYRFHLHVFGAGPEDVAPRPGRLAGGGEGPTFFAAGAAIVCGLSAPLGLIAARAKD